MGTVDKKPITSEIRNLKIGEVTSFPIEQLYSVRAVIGKLKKEMVRENAVFNYKEDYSQFKVIVERSN